MILSECLVSVTLILQLLLPAVIGSDDVDTSQHSPWLLGAQDFKLTAQLKVIRADSLKIDERIKVNEYYSNSQRRARINLNYHDDVLNRFVDYYYAQPLGERSLVRTVTGRGFAAECKSVDADSLASGLFGEMSSGDKHLTGSDWLSRRQDVPDHIIGLSRLLLIVEGLRKSFVYTTQQNTEIRNQKVIRYSAEVRLGGDAAKPSQLVVYYGRTSAHWDTVDLPLRIWIILPDRAEIVVDYLNIEPFNELENYDGFSMFTLPPGIGCSLQHELQPRPASEVTTTGKGFCQWPKMVSFRANLNQITGPNEYVALGRYFVAYDGYTRTLRRDSLGVRSQPTEYSITIHDLKRDLKFNLRDHVTPLSDRNSSESSESDPMMKFNAGRCVSMKANSDIAKNPYEPIIPFDKLVELGRATVRGVRTVAYEQTVKILPEILFPRVNFERINGSSIEVYEPNLSALKGELDDLSVVYFIPEQVALNVSTKGDKSGSALRGERFGILMRIDVFVRGKLNYRAEIYDYVWQLSDAPNGDRQHELFSVHNNCPTSVSASLDSQYAKISLKMSYHQSDKKISPTNSSRRAYELLSNPIIRNQASIRAITMNSILSASQIGDIESHLSISADEKSLQVEAEGQLSDLRARLYRVVSVGSGGLLNMNRLFESSTTFDQCLWEAAHKRLSGPVLFTFCFSYCLIDDKPIKLRERGDQTDSSRLFYMKADESLPCQVFKLDDRIAPIKTDWKAIYNSLRLQVIRLPIFARSASEIQYLPENLSFRIDQVKIANNKWSSTALSAAKESIIISGLSLTENSGKLMKPARSDHGAETGLDFGKCQAGCVADLECRSFSICHIGQRIECRKSALDLRNERLLQRVKDQVRQFRRDRKPNASGIIKLEVEQPDQDQNEGSATTVAPASAHVELLVDKRCEMSAKQALGMFKMAPKALTKLKRDTIIAVDDEEQCAELCLAKNVKFFRRLAKAKLNVSSELLTNPDVEDRLVSKLIEQRNDNMRSWCAMFRFLSLITSTQTENIRQFLNDPSKADRNGLCVLSRPSWAPTTPKVNSGGNATGKNEQKEDRNLPLENSTKVLMDSYEFIYTTLYEQQNGFILNPFGNQSEPTSINGKFLSNQQLVSEQSDVEVCARACFSQTIGMKPWCKSFDFIQDRSAGLSANKRRVEVTSFCVFNSISLADLTWPAGKDESQELTEMKIQQLVRDSPPERVFYTHFEPRNSYTLDHIVSNRLRRQQSINSEFVFQSWAILILLLLSFCSGLTVGLALIGPLLIRHLYGDHANRRESIEYPSRAFLNSLVESDSISHKRFELDIDHNI